MAWSKQLSMLLLGWLLALSVQAANEILTFDNEALRERYTELVFQMRCPKCENQNVADSNTPISEDIRQKTYEMLHQGYSNQEIIDFMIARYSEFVTYKPQMSVVTVWLWLVPAMLLMFGFAILWHLTHRRSAADTAELSAEETQRLKELLEESSE